MTLSSKTQKTVWGLFAGRCAICRERLIHAGENGERSLIGEIAHIVGKKPGSARSTSSMNVALRDDPDNLILLCAKHHKIVDDNPTQYPVEKLSEIRLHHLAWLTTQLEPPAAWHIEVSAFTYLNVPRLNEYAELNGFKVPTGQPPSDVALNDMGWDLNRVMAAYKSTLENLSIKSVAVKRVEFAHSGYIGQLVRFDRMEFRTRNVPQETPKPGRNPKFSGDLDKDPHIYRQFADWKLVLNINPRWITTDTAFGLFRPSGGRSTFTGFARITAVDLETGVMTATALAVGVPKPLFDIFDRAPRLPSDAVDFEALADPISSERATEWGGDVPHCDFCGKGMRTEPYMVDGPKRAGGPWGCMCSLCYSKSRLPLGIGKGQLYRRDADKWVLIGGYPLSRKEEEEG